MIKLFVVADLLRPLLTTDERARVSAWARQWIAVGEQAADGARDWPWVPDITVGGRVVNPAPYGNSPLGQRAMAVWAAAVAGEPYLSQTLAWNWQHTTPSGKDYGWVDLLDNVYVAGGGGETIEGLYRSSVGYGLFGWAALLLIAEVARHAGAGANLFTATSHRGDSLLTAARFYGPLLTGARPNPYAAQETFGSGSYDEIRSEYRAVFETASANCPSGDPNCAALAAVVGSG